jgi:hypothetical protein
VWTLIASTESGIPWTGDRSVRESVSSGFRVSPLASSLTREPSDRLYPAPNGIMAGHKVSRRDEQSHTDPQTSSRGDRRHRLDRRYCTEYRRRGYATAVRDRDHAACAAPARPRSYGARRRLNRNDPPPTLCPATAPRRGSTRSSAPSTPSERAACRWWRHWHRDEGEDFDEQQTVVALGLAYHNPAWNGPDAIFDVVRGLLSTVQRPVAWAREYIARETAG